MRERAYNELLQRQEMFKQIIGKGRGSLATESLIEMINLENNSEGDFRKMAVRQYIHSLGIAEYMKDIIDGMNKTCERVILYDDGYASLKQVAIIMMHDNRALLKFAFDYVDKWKKYNELDWIISEHDSVVE